MFPVDGFEGDGGDQLRFVYSDKNDDRMGICVKRGMWLRPMVAVMPFDVEDVTNSALYDAVLVVKIKEEEERSRTEQETSEQRVSTYFLGYAFGGRNEEDKTNSVPHPINFEQQNNNSDCGLIFDVLSEEDLLQSPDNWQVYDLAPW